MNIGFTGTQLGMTETQQAALKDYLRVRQVDRFHHGDCVGADEQAHDIARSLRIDVVLHPPTSQSKRAFCKAQYIEPQRPYLDRNLHIVDAADLLIACPSRRQPILRSGTWATIRQARRRNVRVLVIYPDGETEAS